MVIRRAILALIISLAIIAVMIPVNVTYGGSGIKVVFKIYTVNIFGWELTHVKTIAYAIMEGPKKFDTQLSYTTRRTWVAWYCFTCYASASPKNKVVKNTVIGEDTSWVQGSWNIEYRGANHVWLYIYGDYKVKEKVYYDINSAVNKVAETIKKVVEFIVDIYSKLAG